MPRQISIGKRHPQIRRQYEVEKGSNSRKAEIKSVSGERSMNEVRFDPHLRALFARAVETYRSGTAYCARTCGVFQQTLTGRSTAVCLPGARRAGRPRKRGQNSRARIYPTQFGLPQRQG